MFKNWKWISIRLLVLGLLLTVRSAIACVSVWGSCKLLQVTDKYVSLFMIVYSTQPRSQERNWERGCVVLCTGAEGPEPAGVLIYFAGVGVGAGKT